MKYWEIWWLWWLLIVNCLGVGGKYFVWSLVCLLIMFSTCNLSMNVFWAKWTKCHPSQNHKKILQTKLSESFYHYHYWLLLVVGLVSFSVQSQHLGMSFLWIKFLLQVIIIFFICSLYVKLRIFVTVDQKMTYEKVRLYIICKLSQKVLFNPEVHYAFYLSIIT